MKFLTLYWIGILTLLTGCSSGHDTSQRNLIDLSQARPYQIIESEPNVYQIGEQVTFNDDVWPSGTRRKIDAFIYNENGNVMTFEARAQTAIKAAILIQEGTKADVVCVTLIPTKTSAKKLALGYANYITDGKGFLGDSVGMPLWEVRAARDSFPGDKTIPPLPLEVYTPVAP